MADLSWAEHNSRFVEDDQVLELSYYEKKTNSYCTMTYNNDAKTWFLDVLVMLSVHLILKGKSDDTNEGSVKHIFPTLQTVKQEGVSRKISKMLKDQVGHVVGLDNKVSSHDIRYGSMDDMSRIALCDIISIICRGGWAFESECTAFRYVSQRMDVIRGGRALSGYETPNLIAPQSSLKAIVFENLVQERKCLALMHKLFSALPCSSVETDRLYSAKETLFATLLENIESIDQATKWTDDNGKQHSNVLIDTLKGSCLGEHIDYYQLLLWGKQVSY